MKRTIKKTQRLLALFFVISLITLPASAKDQTVEKSTAIKVEIVGEDGKYQLLRGGKPYHVKGAGIDHADLESLVAHGGNSFRTWAVDDGAEPALQLLDRAHALGLTVSLCLEFGRERQGFDYNDPELVARQFEESKARVLKYKDHPALLTWFIGNELNMEFQNPKVFAAVNDVSKMIHQLDPNHPTTTPLAAFDKRALQAINEFAPDLDFISFQAYGGLHAMPEEMDSADYVRPYFVTEWGSVGHWEVGKTSWGAPVEHTSSEKATNYSKSYQNVLRPFADQAIGNYVFLWGQKQEKTPTWYGMFLTTGEKTEAVDIMHHIWNGKWPSNRAPSVSPISLNNKTAFDDVKLTHGKQYTASLDVVDADNDELTYKWEIRAESASTNIGGDHEKIPSVVEGLIKDTSAAEVSLTAPMESGAYRLFAYVYDGNNNAAHANIPFYVQ